MIISVIGQGKLGKPIADVFERKFKVIRIDNNKKLGYRNSYRNLGDITFVVVPTPSMPNDAFSSEFIEAVLNKITQKQTVVIVSTLMPGETDRLQKKYRHLELVYNPTFVALGSVAHDFMYPDFILIGTRKQKVAMLLAGIYENIIDRENVPVKVMSPLEAEIAKLSLNCYITTKITFANQIGNLCHRIGVDANRILSAIGTDHRIGNAYFNAGLSYGGPCFPRDNLALSAFFREQSLIPYLFETVHTLNDNYVDEIVERVRQCKPKVVGFPNGLSYKSGTNCQERSALKAIYERLKEEGYKVVIGKGDVNISWEGICRK